MIYDIHLWVLCLLTAVLALLGTAFILKPPGIHHMDTADQHLTSLRNLLINISVFSSVGILTGFLINLLIVFMGSEKIQNKYFDAILILISFLAWVIWVWGFDNELSKTPPTNSIMRVTNRFTTKKRDLPLNQGEVDNSIKFRGPIFSIINVFDEFQGFVETESRENINHTLEELDFKNDEGSALLNLSYAICDPDAYASGGDTAEIRTAKVENALSVYIRNIIEPITKKKSVSQAIELAQQLSELLSEHFASGIREIEAKLGIRIQFIQVSKLNQSRKHADAIQSIGFSEEVRKRARSICRDAKKEGTPISWEKALEFASIWAEKGTLTVNKWDVDAKGLENLRTLITNPEKGGGK